MAFPKTLIVVATSTALLALAFGQLLDEGSAVSPMSQRRPVAVAVVGAGRTDDVEPSMEPEMSDEPIF